MTDVYQLLTDLQLTWTYLDPLLIESDEVKKELREDANYYGVVDIEVDFIRQIRLETSTVKNVCSQEAG